LADEIVQQTSLPLVFLFQLPLSISRSLALTHFFNSLLTHPPSHSPTQPQIANSRALWLESHRHPTYRDQDLHGTPTPSCSSSCKLARITQTRILLPGFRLFSFTYPHQPLHTPTDHNPHEEKGEETEKKEKEKEKEKKVVPVSSQHSPKQTPPLHLRFHPLRYPRLKKKVNGLNHHT